MNNDQQSGQPHREEVCPGKKDKLDGVTSGDLVGDLNL
jgi:hypothetical protein